VILKRERGVKGVEIGAEHLEPTRVMGPEHFLALYDVK
jgi:hypothetical protein